MNTQDRIAAVSGRILPLFFVLSFVGIPAIQAYAQAHATKDSKTGQLTPCPCEALGKKCTCNWNIDVRNPQDHAMEGLVSAKDQERLKSSLEFYIAKNQDGTATWETVGEPYCDSCAEAGVKPSKIRKTYNYLLMAKRGVEEARSIYEGWKKIDDLGNALDGVILAPKPTFREIAAPGLYGPGGYIGRAGGPSTEPLSAPPQVGKDWGIFGGLPNPEPQKPNYYQNIGKTFTEYAQQLANATKMVKQLRDQVNDLSAAQMEQLTALLENFASTDASVREMLGGVSLNESALNDANGPRRDVSGEETDRINAGEKIKGLILVDATGQIVSSEEIYKYSNVMNVGFNGLHFKITYDTANQLYNMDLSNADKIVHFGNIYIQQGTTSPSRTHAIETFRASLHSLQEALADKPDPKDLLQAGESNDSHPAQDGVFVQSWGKSNPPVRPMLQNLARLTDLKYDPDRSAVIFLDRHRSAWRSLLGAEQFRAGDHETARQTIQDAYQDLVKSNKITTDGATADWGYDVESVAKAQILIGDIVSARLTTRSLSQTVNKDFSNKEDKVTDQSNMVLPFAEVIRLLAKQGYHSDVLNFERQERIANPHSSMLPELACIEAEAGYAASARDSISRSSLFFPPEPYMWSYTFDVECFLGNFVKAQQMANHFVKPIDRIQGLCSIAKSLSKAGYTSRAKILITQAQQIRSNSKKQLSNEEGEYYPGSECSISIAQVSVGDMTSAHELLLSGVMRQPGRFLYDYYYTDEIFPLICNLVQHGKVAAAKKIAYELGPVMHNQYARTFEQLQHMEDALVLIASKQMTAGDISGAKMTLEEALDNRKLLQQPMRGGSGSEASGFTAIAIAQAKIGDFVGAQRTITEIQDWEGPNCIEDVATAYLGIAKAMLDQQKKTYVVAH